jgi:hypothetical protein
MVEIGVDKNSTIMFPAPLMSTIGDIGEFLRRESTAATPHVDATPRDAAPRPNPNGERAHDEHQRERS